MRDAACGEGRSRIRAGKLPRNMACLSNATRSIVRRRGRFHGQPQAWGGQRGLENFAMTLQHHGMSTMNVSLPQALRSFVDEQVASGGYGAASEYVRELLRRDRDRQRLRGLLLDGAASASTAPADKAYFGELRERVRTSRQA